MIYIRCLMNPDQFKDMVIYVTFALASPVKQ